MRVVHLLVPEGFDLPSRPSGGNIYDRRLARGLAEAGWCVRVWPVAGTWQPVSSGADRPLADILTVIPDAAVVLVDGLVAGWAGSALLPHTGRLRVVVLVHQPAPDAHRRATERALLGTACAVVTTSEWTRELLVTHEAVPAGRIRVAAPGVDPAPLAPASSSGERLLCVAAVTREKGHDVLVTALGAIRDLRWRCTCVGPLDRDVELVRELGVSPHGTLAGDPQLPVTFTGTRVGAALHATYAATDLVVLASRSETYGMVVTEALARGVPVVATAVGGVAQALGAAPTGLPGALVPPEDPEALASVVRAWLTDPGLRSRWRAAARERRRTLPRWSDTTRLVAQVLDGAAA